MLQPIPCVQTEIEKYKDTVQKLLSGVRNKDRRDFILTNIVRFDELKETLNSVYLDAKKWSGYQLIPANGDIHVVMLALTDFITLVATSEQFLRSPHFVILEDPYKDESRAMGRAFLVKMNNDDSPIPVTKSEIVHHHVKSPEVRRALFSCNSAHIKLNTIFLNSSLTILVKKTESATDAVQHHALWQPYLLRTMFNIIRFFRNVTGVPCLFHVMLYGKPAQEYFSHVWREHLLDDIKNGVSPIVYKDTFSKIVYLSPHPVATHSIYNEENSKIEVEDVRFRTRVTSYRGEILPAMMFWDRVAADQVL